MSPQLYSDNAGLLRRYGGFDSLDLFTRNRREASHPSGVDPGPLTHDGLQTSLVQTSKHGVFPAEPLPGTRRGPVTVHDGIQSS